MTAIRRVSPQEARDLQGRGYVYVDVRTEEEFAEGHPEGSWNVPWTFAGSVANAEFVPTMSRLFAKDAKIVLGCRSGNRSMRAAEALVAAGFTDLYEQRAGFDASKTPYGEIQEKGWSRAGLPVETGAPAERSWKMLKG